MKALILNSGIGSRMGKMTEHAPKCMTEICSDGIPDKDTLLSRQLRMLEIIGVNEVVITTGYLAEELKGYCRSLAYNGNIVFVHNPMYRETNYIYSIYLAKDYLTGEDIIMLHGDLVFDFAALCQVAFSGKSCMAVDSGVELPEKDFKAVISQTEEQCITDIGIEFFDHAVSAQPLYRLDRNDWDLWLGKIVDFCENGNTGCYAENAFNELNGKCVIYPCDVNGMLCNEVDTPEDLACVSQKLMQEKSVYCCFSTDIVHGGHIKIIEAARELGTVTAGILSDEAVAGYKRYPLLSFKERSELVSHISGVHNVIKQEELSYKNNLRKLRPDYVVHGDDWKSGFQSSIRQEVLTVLSEWGGKLVELPYSKSETYELIENDMRSRLSIPDMRRRRLRNLLDMKGLVTAIEAHSGITGLIAEKTTVLQAGRTYQFDAMWVSSLCDSTAKGKPDIELVDMTSRFRTIDDIMEVTTKPIIFDGDTGGLTEHFVYTVKSLERMGVSAVIIEDKTGLKKNSLFGTEVAQTQDSIENFCQKISAGKKAQKTREFMIIARIESLILERGMEDALARADAYVKAGADGIMIHSRKKDPSEIFGFITAFRAADASTPLVVVPTSFNSVKEEEWKERGVNVVIYANQLTRSAFPAMQNTARSILENHRSLECDGTLMSIKDILTLIPEDI